MEIKTMKMLDHPHITKIHDVIDTQEHVCVVLEFCQSGELFDIIQRHGKVTKYNLI